MDKNIPGGSGTPVSEHADNLEVSDFFELDDWIIDEDPMFVSPEYPQNEGDAANEVVNSSAISASGSGYGEGDSSTGGGGGGSGKKKKEFTEKVAFKTKSEVEILDDGFKWRKYGKKMVKNSPNPRNYYKCSVEGCSVKKRVERDRDDPRYVVTTYEGVHNHQGPQ